tara:strand:- start:803 stop:982 length:180 start_codon:yes stop_codon:yes gene_type:complete
LKTKKILVRNLEVEVNSRKIIIYDKDGIVSDDHAVSIVSYLREEGFIEDIAVRCEIIVG